MINDHLPDLDPRPLSTSLDHLTRTLGMPSPAVMEVVFSQWAALVDPVVATHAQPASLRGEGLVVDVDDPAWGSELRYRAHHLLSAMAERIGPGSPTRMEVRVRPAGTRGSRPSVVNSAHRNWAP